MPQAIAGCDSCPADDDPCRKAGNCSQCGNAFGEGGSYKSVETPPKDFNEWYKLVHAMATHMVERHGLAEVSTWHWEVWNEMYGYRRVSFVNLCLCLSDIPCAGGAWTTRRTVSARIFIAESRL